MNVQDTVTKLGKLLEIQARIADIHPLLQHVYPVAVVYAEQFFIFDVTEQRNGFQHVQTTPTPFPVPVGVRAAFPLEAYDNRVACVVSPQLFDEPDGYVTLLHEYVHCYQFESDEIALKQSLTIAREAVARQDFMWEINHPFPYEAERFAAAYGRFLTTMQTNEDVTAVRQELSQMLSQHDFEYMVWQEWKEGFARFIENKVRQRFGFPLNSNGLEPPFSRVTFYAGGAAFISSLRQKQPDITEDLTMLFAAMKRPLA